MGKRYLRKAIKNKNKKIHLLPFFLGNKADLCDFARFLFLFRFIKIHYKRSLSATNSAFLKCLCSFCICILMVVKPPFCDIRNSDDICIQPKTTSCQESCSLVSRVKHLTDD